VISDQYRVHHEILSNAKATLKTRLPLPVSSNKLNMQKSSEGFHVTKANKSLLSEHLLNIKHMKRRIKSIGSVSFKQYNERKKNPFDPITHPVVFFRSGREGDDPTLNKRFIHKSVKPPKVNEVYSTNERRVETSSDVQIEVPFIDSFEKNPGKALKTKLLEVIVNNRIYKEIDIQELFKVTRETNSHLDSAQVEKAINLAYKELNC
jgi:hypothetical protein